MPRLGSVGSIVSSIAVAGSIEWLSLSEWGYQQKRSFLEAYDTRGFSYAVEKETHLCRIAADTYKLFKSAALLPKSMYDDSLPCHLFLSATRDGISLSTYGHNLWAVGLPQFFLNTSPENINRSAVKLRHSLTYLWIRRNKREDSAHTLERKRLNELQWNSEAGQELLKSLVAPQDSAIKFIYARSLLGCAHNEKYVHANAFAFGIVPGISYVLVQVMKSTFKQKVLPRALMIIIYSGATILALSGSITLLDFYRCSVERRVDKKVASLSSDFAEGGVMYYNQLLAQNRALRQLQIDAGDWKAAQSISPIGDPISFIRQKSLPLSVRRDICVAVADTKKK